MENSNSENSKSKKAVKIVIVAILIAIFVGSGIYLGVYFHKQYEAKQDAVKISKIAETTTSSANDKKNPIDFASLKKQNNEIYSWIVVPGTNVDYPIVQSESDDLFYLDHSAYDKSYIESGAIFSQSCNKKDFSDPVTLVYGHNGYSDIMFVTLHRFEDKTFFDKHKYMYIYTEDSKKTYEIYSAFRYDNRHIMNSFDFTNVSTLMSFQQTTINPSTTMRNVRDGANLKSTDKIIVLSTCLNNDNSGKYLVCGVLVKDEATK